MRIGALSLFKKTSSATIYNIASWHWRGSLTWRWVFSLDTDISYWERKKPYYMKLSGGRLWGFYLPFVGKFRYQSQSNMFNAPFIREDRKKAEWI